MTNSRKFPWLNVWMIFFGALGIWAHVKWYWPTSRISWTEWLSFILGTATPAIILLVGLLRFPRSSCEDGAEIEPLSLAVLGSIYLGALRKIGRHRWILAIFGIIALTAFAGAVGDLSLYAQYRAGNPMFQSDPSNQPDSGLLRPILAAAPRLFIDGLSKSFGSFRIGREIRNSGGIAFFLFSLLLLIAAICYQKKITSLTREPGLARQARFATILLPAALVFWLVGLLQIKTALSAIAMTAPQNPNMLLALMRHIFVAMVAGLAIGGLAGCLHKMEGGGSITRDTFLKDMIRYFWPVMGIYLLVEMTWFLLTFSLFKLISYTAFLAEPVPLFISLHQIGFMFMGMWPIAALLLVLAPYAAVRQDLGMWDAIRQGIRCLRRNLWDAVSFIALGVTFVGMAYTITGVTSIDLRHSESILLHGIIAGVINLAATAVISSVMVVAVWDFYACINQEQREQAPPL